ncbi:MAG: siderophore-interacting protein [Thermomicrobiales bacterium]|nr:siderophore-interacting protein [Thermomicrobiales bacterium]
MRSVSESAVRTVRFPLVPRRLEVQRVQRVTPRLVRITLGGKALEGFQTLSPQDHVKLIIPSGGSPLLLPEVTDQGLQFPAGFDRSSMRDYTPRRFDAGAGELDLDIVLHGAGLVSTWAEQVEPGEAAGVLGPRGSHIVEPVFPWYLFAGDETALPTIARWLEELPAGTRAIAVIEVADAAEEQKLETAAELDVHWVHRAAAPGQRDLLETAVRQIALPEGDGFVWAGGEATALTPIRRYFLRECRLPRERVEVSGHWKRGVTDWDHHEEIPE